MNRTVAFTTALGIAGLTLLAAPTAAFAGLPKGPQDKIGLPPKAVPTVSVADVVVVEGTGGFTSANVVISLDQPASEKATVLVSWFDSTATSPDDYGDGATSLTFLPGEQAQQLEIPVVTDDLAEADEVFEVQLTMPQSVKLGDAFGFVTIVDDDTPEPPADVPAPAAPDADAASVVPVDLPATTVAPAPTTTAKPATHATNGDQIAAGVDVAPHDGGNSLFLVALLTAGACVTAALLALLVVRRRQS